MLEKRPQKVSESSRKYLMKIFNARDWKNLMHLDYENHNQGHTRTPV